MANANHEKLTNVIPALLTKVTEVSQTSDRHSRYDCIDDLHAQIGDRFAELAPSSDELDLTIDMESKQKLEEQIDEWLEKTVTPALIFKTKQDVPEWLMPRHKKTVDFYEAAFAEIAQLDAEVGAMIDQNGEEETVAHMQTKYQEWRSIYDAQQAKGDLMDKVAEIVDIKQGLIGMLRMLNVSPQEIQHTIYSAG